MTVSTERPRVRKATTDDARIRLSADVRADDEGKTKKQLLNEITDLRRRIREADRGFAPDSIETELKGTRQRLQYLLTLSPAIIYTTKASGDFGCRLGSKADIEICINVCFAL